MTIRYGVSPIAWINDDMPELGGNTPLYRVFTDIQEIGFAGVELGGKFPRDPQELATLLAGYSLQLVGGWYSSSLLDHDAATECARLRTHLDLLKALGSSVFICAETSNAIHGNRSVPLERTPRLDASGWRTFGARLTELADYIAGQGMRFAYHHHLGTVVERAEDLENFILHTGPAVGLTLDTGHAALGGIDAVQIVRRHAARIAHVHCKDIRGDVHRRILAERRSFLDGVVAGMFTAPGDGDIDFGPLMSELAANQYAGWIIVEAEQDPAVADPRSFSTLGLATLRAAADRAGLR